jgi:chromosome segregation ATPase
MDDKPNYDTINKLMVSIASHKTQLNKSNSIDEMENICRSIWEMESEILMERKKELKSLQSKKEDLLQKMAGLEASLDEVNREINARLGRYRESVTSRLSRLEGEMNGKKGELGGEVETPSIE